LIVLCSAPASAAQFVLLDVTFDYTYADALNSRPSMSHHYVTDGQGMNAARPLNWTSPVNYRDGTVHLHLEVLQKPAGAQPVGWALCYVGNAGSYGCPYTPYYTATGTYERDVSMRSFFQNDTIDWSRGVKQLDMVYTVNDTGNGHVHNFPNLQNLVAPTRVRLAMVQVSAGSVYDPSILNKAPEPRPPDAGPALDAGSPGAAAPDAGTPDAGAIDADPAPVEPRPHPEPIPREGTPRATGDVIVMDGGCEAAPSELIAGALLTSLLWRSRRARAPRR
jgi:hypothetical protein